MKNEIIEQALASLPVDLLYAVYLAGRRAGQEEIAQGYVGMSKTESFALNDLIDALEYEVEHAREQNAVEAEGQINRLREGRFTA